jgi:hypothetical protein
MFKISRLSHPLGIILVLFTVAGLLAPGPAQALTQRDWMIALTDSLGRSFGLPDEPKFEDYRDILLGNRTFRFEAEAVHAEDDEVTTFSYVNYGPFSGSGWVLGSGKPTPVHLRFVLPLDGRYRLSMALYRPGHAAQIGEQRFTADGDALRFSTVELGELQLTAGLQEVVVTLPPGGALDYLELSAPGLPTIVPDGGWQADAPLGWDALAITTLQALGLAHELPASGKTIAIEAETLAGTGGARVVEDAHLGRPSGGRWLRTSAQPARVEVPLTIEQTGYFDIELTVLGTSVNILADSLQLPVTAGKPYLNTVTTPPVFLTRGSRPLVITLPPGGGLDRIVLKGRQSDLPALAAVLGLTVTGDTPTTADLDQLTKRLASVPR